MTAKECLWAKFRATCPVPNACQLPQMPSSCGDCGWDSEAAWEACVEKLSPIARVVEEILASEEANEAYSSGNDPF